MPRKLYNHELAEAFFASPEYMSDLVYASEPDVFYLWGDYYYKIIEYDDFLTIVLNFLRANFPNQAITMGVVEDVVKQIKRCCLRRIIREDLDYIAFRDCYYDLNKFEIAPTDKSKIVAFSFPFFYKDIDVPTPNFTRLIHTSFVERDDHDVPDLEIINLVQEMFGYLLINNLKAQVAFFLVGKGNNGKGVLARVIEEVIGSQYITAKTIQMLTTDKWATSALVGKRVNISGEEESKYIRSDKFKALVSGDMIDAERKFGGSFSFRPYTRYFFTSNDLPVFEGVSYGLLRRFKILPMYKIFKGSEIDRDLFDKIKPETPGVVKWVIEGARRLVIDNNYSFSDSAASQRALTDFEESISSAIMFIRDQGYVPSPDSFTTYEGLYTLFRVWCSDEGKKVVAKRRFIKEVLDNIKGAEKRIGYFEGKTARGINLVKIDNKLAEEHYKQQDEQQLLQF
jgi:P4 family phage/plasmid primase-like protien